MEMVDRAVTVANLKLVGRGDRRADIGLGLTNRALERFAPGEMGRDRRRQRAAGAMVCRVWMRLAANGVTPSARIR